VVEGVLIMVILKYKYFVHWCWRC